MSLTSNSDFYVAVHDGGINRVVKHLMRQRPSIFNYATSAILADPKLLCERIDVAPEAIRAGNPIAKLIDPLPVFGTSYGLNFCIQLSKGQIDFHPGNVVNLPAELNPPLANQHLSLQFRICAGIGCPTLDFTRPPKRNLVASRQLPSIRPSTEGMISEPSRPISPLPERPTSVLPTSRLECVCLDLFATGGCKVIGPVGNQRILPRADGIEIVDLKPEGLENAVECYALTTLNLRILPTVGETISNAIFNFIDLPKNYGKLRISALTSVPNNPSIEQDQLKAYINLDTIDLNIVFQPGGGVGGGGSGGGDSAGGGGGSTVSRTIRPRSRSGIFDLTAALSEKAFIEIFDALIKGFKFSKSGNLVSVGSLSISYSVAAHLEGGLIELRNDGTIKITELDVKWDTLRLDICFNIPEICIGGFCLLPPPPLDQITGCAVTAPTLCFFSASPDFCIPVDLGELITSEITLTASPKVFYGVGAGAPNRWQIVLVPQLPIDIDIIDIADTVGDLVQNLIDLAIDNVLSGAPDWAKDLVRAILGPIDDILRIVLDIPDDIGEWLLDITSNLGIFQSLLDALYNWLAFQLPAALEIEDPYEVLPAKDGLVPVKIPLEFIGIRVNSSEMVIEGDIGN